MPGIRSIPFPVLAILALAIVGIPAPAMTGAPFVGPRSEAPSPLLVLARTKKCVTLMRQAGRDVLVNRCASCRVVSVQKNRPGEGFPVTRTLTLAKRSKTPLSFRGPGNARILSDAACGDSTPEKLQGGKCVRFHRFPDGSPALFNQCPACRIAVVEREAVNGHRTRTSYSVTNRAYVPLLTHGAKAARIVSDKACK